MGLEEVLGLSLDGWASFRFETLFLGDVMRVSSFMNGNKDKIAGIKLISYNKYDYSEEELCIL